MKRLLLLVCVLALGACSSGEAEPLALTALDDGTTVEASVDDVITVTLQSNPSTGYSWNPEVPDNLQLVHQDYEQASDLVGASGFEIFEFRVTAAGEGTLAMTYGQSWDPGSTDGTFEVTFVTS